MLKLKAQLLRAGEIAIGPGKAALLEAIAREGSISGAARALNMSYRRGWVLADTMNRAFAAPLIETAAGGSHGGGARLTPAGEAALARYRALEAAIAAAAQEDARALEAMLKPGG